MHLREDRRHIQDRDLKVLRQVIKGKLNMEMAATEEMIGIASMVGPDICTFVPERRQELTTEGGLDVKNNLEQIKDAAAQLNEAGIPVSNSPAYCTDDVANHAMSPFWEVTPG